MYSSSRRSRYGRASQLRCTLPFTPPVPAEAERSRARVPTLAPGGACLMTSLTKNAPASPLQCALTKSQDLNPPGINTYKKPGASPLLFSLLPASLLPWLMAGTRLSPMAPAPHASMNDRPSLSYQRRRQQPQPETAPRLSLRNSSARVGILTLLFHGGKIMQLGHIAEGVVDGSGDGCYKISSLSNARRSAPRRGAQFRWGNPSGGSRNLPAYGCMEILSQLGELFLQALPTVIIVFLFYLFLRSNFFQPLERVLAERWARTEGARRAAEASQAAAQEKLRAYQEALKKARTEIYAEQEAARRAVLEERTALIRNARSRAAEEVRAAKEKISADLAAARAEIQLASETLAEEIARVILERRPVAHQSISEVR